MVKPVLWESEYRSFSPGQLFARLAYRTTVEGMTTLEAIEILKYYTKDKKCSP